jgi:hypothetical protein
MDRASFPDFFSIADLLGIDVEKPAEFWDCGRGDSGLRLTGGWYHVVGRIVSGRDAKRQIHETAWQSELEKLPDGVEFGFTGNLALVPLPFSGKSLIQFEFTMSIPWILAEPEPNP